MFGFMSRRDPATGAISVTRLIDRLVRDGLVERSHCATDARGAEAVLTASGLDRLREAAPTHRIYLSNEQPVREGPAPDGRTYFRARLDSEPSPEWMRAYRAGILGLMPEDRDAVIEYVGKLPSPQCEIFFGAIGGATTRPAPGSAAYPHRDAKFVMNFHGRWEDPADDERCIAWAREFFNATAPFASGSVYVNFLTADEGDRVRAAYGPNYDRLVQVKRKYDPNNLFRMNQNIAPA